MKLLEYIQENSGKLTELLVEHVGLTILSLLLAIAIAVPGGVLIRNNGRLAGIVLGVVSVLQTIPSIALLGFLIPILGIGLKPAVFALFLYALLPILRNTFTGVQQVDPAVVEAARGLGMNPWQVLWKVELPLALPVIFAGIRTATVINVGVAALAAYIGAGGLGEFIFGGIALNNTNMLLAGALPAALLAIILDQLFALGRFMKRKTLTKAAPVIATLVLLAVLLSACPTIYADQLTAAFDPEFLGRQDGYAGLKKRYGLSFNTSLVNASLMYSAIKENKVDIISGYSTDGRIKAYNLKVLEDDKGVFPPYYCAALVNENTAQTHPEVVEVLEKLAGKISDPIMMELNYQVDFEKKSPAVVAQKFLQSLNLWRPDQSQGGEKIILGSKIFSEQYILTEIFSQLINGYTELDVDARPGLGGTKICFDALKAGEIDIYPEYTGTGLLVLLEADEDLIQSLNHDKEAVYQYLKKTFLKDLGIRWLAPIGFNNTYALVVRSDKAEKMGWNKVSDLP